MRHHILLAALTFCSPLAPAATAVLADPFGLAIDARGNLLVSCRGEESAVVVLSRSGERLREIGSGRLSSPGGIAVDAAGRVAVASTGGNEVVLLEEDGRVAAAAGGLSAPSHVAFGPGGIVLASEPGSSRVAVLDAALKGILFSIRKVDAGEGPGELRAPAGIAVAGGELAVSDAGNHRVLVGPLPAGEGQGLRPRLVLATPGMEPAEVAFGADGRLYVVDRGRVVGFARDGKELGGFRAAAVRLWYSPRGLAVDPAGRVLSVDASTRRVLATTADLFDAEPRVAVSPADPTTATVEWTTPFAAPAVLRYGLTEDCDLVVRDGAPETRHRVVLRDLRPSTRYYLHVSDPIEAIPPTTPRRTDLALETQRKSYGILADGNFSGEYAFATHPGPGRIDWASVPVLVLVYRRVSFAAGPDGKAQPDRVLDDGDMTVLRSELETYRLWAWRHSHLKVNLDYTWVIVDEGRDAGLLGDITGPVLDDLLRGVKSQGKDLAAFWNVIVVGTHGWYASYLAGTVAGSPYELGSCYTGFGHGTRSGWWWFPTHEHGHLMHSMILCSGAGHFGFPDAPWTLPGQFGEDFSFLAYNYRQFPVRGWLLIKKSAIRWSADADSNGVPDDDPAVPLDQRRFCWRPEMGGDCLRRIMAGVRTPGFPGSTDADHEGKDHPLNDGELYWVDRRAPRSTPVLDGRIAEGEWKELYSIPNLTTPADLRGLRAKVFVAWDEKCYYFAVRASRRVAAGIDLDGASDGWFHGRDNLRLSVRPAEGRPGAGGEGAIWDFLDDAPQVHDGQLWWRGAYAPGDIAAAGGGGEGGWFDLECAVPARPAIGIRPSRGAKIGLRVTVWADPPDPISATGFFDGEDFVYDIACTD